MHFEGLAGGEPAHSVGSPAPNSVAVARGDAE